MKVTLELLQARREETVDLPPGATGFDLLRQLGLAPDAHLVVRGDMPIPLDETLADGERLQIFSAVSGGWAEGEGLSQTFMSVL